MLKLSDGRNFGRTLTGLAMIAAPVVFIPADALSPRSDSDSAQRLADIAANKGAAAASLVLVLVAAILLLVGAFGLIHLFRAPGVTLGQVGGGLLVGVTLAMIGFYGLGGIEYVMATETGLDQGQMAALLDAADDGAAIFAPLLVLFMIGSLVGSVLVAIANWRRPIAPRWAGLAIVASAVVTIAAASNALNIVSDVLLLAGLGAFGVTALRMSDEEWDAPRVLVGATRPSSAATPVVSSS